MRKLILGVVTILIALAVPVFADWPSTMEIGGFSVTDVSGTSSADNSGRATGKLMIPSDGNCSVDLSRSASGVVTGSTRSGFTVNGIRVDGSFILDRNGLQGAGTIHTDGKPITDADITMSSREGLSGSGSVRLSPSFSVRVQFSARNGGLTVTGSSSRAVTADTPLAAYTFKGDVEISGADKAVKAAAKGVIERKGKVSGTTDSFGPLTFDVDCATGEGKVNVSGSDITIDLW